MTPAASRLARYGERQRGQSLVEFALILPIFVLVLVGIFDVGRAIYATSTINNAAKEAARVAIVDQTPAHITATAIDQAVGLGLAASAVSITYKLADDDTKACVSQTNPGIGCIAVVTVQFQYAPVTPIVGQLVGTVTLKGVSKFPIESSCVEGTPTPHCPKGS